ncbi:MAG: cyclase family protein [Anaerolineae bacterium]
MCSPHVAKSVQERIKREGMPQFNRRDFLRLGGLGMFATAASAAFGLPQPARALQEARKVIDLSHVFGTQIPTYLPGEGPKREDFVTVAKDGFYIQRWTYTEHAGTHVDIPAHFVADGQTVDNYPADLLVGTAVVIDISAKAAESADATLEVADIEAYEAANGQIAAGSIVFMYSGWDARWNDPKAFRNADAQDVQHYPGFSADAAKFLVTERDILGVGVDTLSLDTGMSSTFDAHLTFLAAGKYGIEGVANLAMIKEAQAMVVVGVPRWESGSGGPARVLAIM